MIKESITNFHSDHKNGNAVGRTRRSCFKFQLSGRYYRLPTWDYVLALQWKTRFKEEGIPHCWSKENTSDWWQIQDSIVLHNVIFRYTLIEDMDPVHGRYTCARHRKGVVFCEYMLLPCLSRYCSILNKGATHANSYCYLIYRYHHNARGDGHIMIEAINSSIIARKRPGQAEVIKYCKCNSDCWPVALVNFLGALLFRRYCISLIRDIPITSICSIKAAPSE